MKGRDWLVGSLAAAAVTALVFPTVARAEVRRFTSPPIDTNASYQLGYVPLLMKRLGGGAGAEVPEVLASWSQVALNSEKVNPTGGEVEKYQILEISEKRDPEQPTQPPKIAVVIERDGGFPEGAPPPAIALVDRSTGLE